ncbi:DDE-type integrase/transposase/recombinase [Pseudomonas sp. NBRC 111140]|uniref:DDE-type integrase/transposase/recombinase n=1 Tax=Pseudomonas sp. NBRC 111140 TaxID=1661055 RepID=UPI000760F3C4|nr:DDE-type integrase/transposase/recombinase [Pseudomonas sp. NBRC 111140]
MRALVEFRTGERYHYCGRDYQVMETDGERVQLRSVYGPPQVLYQYLSALRRGVDQGKMLKIQEAPIQTDPNLIIARLPKKEARSLETRVAYVRASLEEYTWVTRRTHAEFIEIMTEKIGPHKAPSFTTLWEWKRTFLDAGRNFTSLIPNTFRPINKHISHQPFEVQNLIKSDIASFYWTTTPFTKTALISSIRLKLDALNSRRRTTEQFRIPSISTLYRIINEIDAHETTLHQRGRKAAKRDHYWGATIPEPERLFERVEADSRPLDIILVDKNGKPLGRPVLTVFIEVKTRFVIAWHISFNPASLDTTILVLRDSLNADNPHGGLAELYIVDNGPEFIAKALRKVLWLMGAEVTFCEPDEPNQKPHVERFFETWACEIEHVLRGTTKESIEARGDYNSEEQAMYTLEQARCIFATWLETYHAARHSTLDMSPNEAWSTAVSTQFQPHRFSGDDLRRCFWRSAEVTGTASGRVRHDNLHWWGPAVSYYRTKQPKAKKLVLYFDAGDVGKAWICHPSYPDDIQPLNALHPAYQNGLTLDFHHLIRAQQKAIRQTHCYCRAEEARTQLLWKIAKANKKGYQPLVAALENGELNLRQVTEAFEPQTPALSRALPSEDYNTNTPGDFTLTLGDD